MGLHLTLEEKDKEGDKEEVVLGAGVSI